MWNLLMGNSTSSDETGQEDNVDGNLTIASNNHTLSKCGPDLYKTRSNNPIAENSGVKESSIIRIGSHHQPLKVTKIENKNGKKQESLPGEGIHVARNRFKLAHDANPPGNNHSCSRAPNSEHLLRMVALQPELSVHNYLIQSIVKVNELFRCQTPHSISSS